MADEKFEVVVFKGKTFGNLLEEVHANSLSNNSLILEIIEDLKVYITSIGDAIQLAPVIASYVKLVVDNNEHIIKIANIVQKSLDRVKDTGDNSFGILTEDEKKDLEALALEWKDSLQLPESTTLVTKPAAKAPKKVKNASK